MRLIYVFPSDGINDSYLQTKEDEEIDKQYHNFGFVPLGKPRIRF